MRQTHGWDLFWKVNILRDGALPLLYRAFHVYIANLLTQIGLRIDQPNQPIFHLQDHICAFSHILEQRANSLDRERATTGYRLATSYHHTVPREYVRSRRIRAQVHMLEDEQIVPVLGFAVRKRIIAWDGSAVT